MTRWLRSHWTQAAALAVLAAVIHTWPLATNPARLSLHYNADVMLNEWIVAWIQHQLPRAPLQLFEANIFYPARNTLAFSEPLIVPALLGWPVRLVGASPVLVHNVLLITGLALSMLAAYAVTHRWTGNRGAALVSGSAFAFNTHLLSRIEHLQAAHAYGLPLAVLATDRLIVTGHRRYAWWLGATLAMMAYTSGYLAIFGVFVAAVLLLVRLREWTAHARRAAGALVIATIGTAIVVLPLYLPYRRAAVEQHAIRSLENVAQFSAAPDAFVASYGRLHGWLWNAGRAREFPDALFPGIVVSALALWSVAISLKRSGREHGGRTAALVVLGAVGAVFALGTRTPVYGFVYEIFPPMASLRAAGRFGLLFLLGVSLLAGTGMHSLRGRLSKRAYAALATALIVLVHVEALRAPFRFVPFQSIPGPYTLLAQEPRPVVLVEVPFYPPQTVFLNAEYVLNSTAHWRPLMNGYSGYTPAEYRAYAKSFWEFPDPAALDAMRAAGATHLMLHPARFDRYAQDTLDQALSNPRLERLAVARDGLTLFRIR